MTGLNGLHLMVAFVLQFGGVFCGGVIVGSGYRVEGAVFAVLCYAASFMVALWPTGRGGPSGEGRA